METTKQLIKHANQTNVSSFFVFLLMLQLIVEPKETVDIKEINGEINEPTVSVVNEEEIHIDVLLTEFERKSFSDNYNLVDKTIEKAISLLNPDQNIGGSIFLKEIAITESMLGMHPNTYRYSGNGGRGIWQIDEIAFIDTKNVQSHPILKKYHRNLKKAGIDWNKVTWNDCNKPLIGAIAARMLILIKPFKISENRAKRAEQWKKYYNTWMGKGTPEKYWENIKTVYNKIGKKDHYPDISLSEFHNFAKM